MLRACQGQTGSCEVSSHDPDPDPDLLRCLGTLTLRLLGDRVTHGKSFLYPFGCETLNESVSISGPLLPPLDNEGLDSKTPQVLSRSGSLGYTSNVGISQAFSPLPPCICSQWPEPHQLRPELSLGPSQH